MAQVARCEARQSRSPQGDLRSRNRRRSPGESTTAACRAGSAHPRPHHRLGYHPATVPHHRAAQAPSPCCASTSNATTTSSCSPTRAERGCGGALSLKPAVSGNEERPLSGARTVPIRRGLTFHGLRHSHKTWPIAGGTPEASRAVTTPRLRPHCGVTNPAAPHTVGGRNATITQSSDQAGKPCSRTAPQGHHNTTNRRSPKIRPRTAKTRLTSGKPQDQTGFSKEWS